MPLKLSKAMHMSLWHWPERACFKNWSVWSLIATSKSQIKNSVETNILPRMVYFHVFSEQQIDP